MERINLPDFSIAGFARTFDEFAVCTNRRQKVHSGALFMQDDIHSTPQNTDISTRIRMQPESLPFLVISVDWIGFTGFSSFGTERGDGFRFCVNFATAHAADERVEPFGESGFQIVRRISKEKFESLVRVMPVPYHDEKIMVQLNPKRLEWCFDQEVLNFIFQLFAKHILDKKLTRVDIAIDLINAAKLHNGYFPHAVGAKTEKIYEIYGRDQTLETLYVGRRASLAQIRYYNKLRERVDKLQRPPFTSWWRLEFQLRSKNARSWRTQCAERLQSFYKTDFSNADDLSISEKAMAIACYHDSNFFLSLSDRTRKKYRKVLRTSTLKKVELTDFLSDSFSLCCDDLVSYLNHFVGRF